LKLVAETSWTAISDPFQSMVEPAERDEANKRSSLIGKLRSSKSLIISLPTAPLAPRTATDRGRSGKKFLGLKLRKAGIGKRLIRRRAKKSTTPNKSIRVVKPVIPSTHNTL